MSAQPSAADDPPAAGASPSVAEVLPAATLRQKPGRPRREVYLLIGRQTGGLAAIAALRDRHLAYLHALQDRGVLLLAGPLLTTDGAWYQGDGCLVVTASDAAAAAAIAADDPYQQAGARTYQVVPWLISEGTLFDALGGCLTQAGG